MTTPSVPLSLRALVKLKPYSPGLGPDSDSDHWHQLLSKLQKLECYTPLEAWVSQLNKQGPDEFAGLSRLFTFLIDYLEEETRAETSRWPARYTTPDARFLWEEFQEFISRTDEQAQEFNAQLDSLDGLSRYPKTRARVQELYFIPGVIFSRCPSVIDRHHQIHKAVEKEQQRLRRLCRQSQESPLLSATLKERMRQEVEVIDAFLALEFPSRHAIDTWRKQLGLDKHLHMKMQKHKIWTTIFVKLVDLLRPFCRGPKRLHLQDNPNAQPYQVFVVTSRLMHLSHPTLWPDESEELVRSRYNANKWK